MPRLFQQLRSFVFTMILISGLTTLAQQKISMNFVNEELLKVLQTYATASNQKFVVDPGFRGKISILLPEPVTLEEAFNHLSSAMAINGYAMSKQGDTIIVKSARNIQRDFIEVSTQRPSMKPERMYTWIYKAKHIGVDSIARELRILNSRDGEVTVHSSTNQLILTDWTANINRIIDLISQIDIPVDAATQKLVSDSRKIRDKEIEHQMRMPVPPPAPPPPLPPKSNEDGSKN